MITPAFSPTATERVLPRLALDFTTASLDPRVTVTRALNTATRVNSSGFVETINANLPRFDYDPATLQCKGLLIEEARSNLFLYSDQFDQFPWAVGDASVTVNSVNSPSGTQNADTLVENSATGVHFIYASVASQPAGSYTFSVYVKANGRSKFRLQQNDTTAYAVLFDIAAQTTTPIAGGATGVITPAGNGWFRCSMTYTTTVPISLLNVIYLADGSGSISYQGDDTSGVYLWGAQLEAGAFATSYIPTTTTSVTRNADVVAMTGTNFSSWYNASQGTFAAIADTAKPTSLVAIAEITSVNDGTSLERVITRFITGSVEGVSVVGGNTEFQLGDSYTVNTPTKIAFAFKTNSFAVGLNGGTPLTSASGQIPSTVNQLIIGGSGNLNGHVYSLRYWPQRLINAETQAFSK